MNKRAQALIEFVLILPVLIMLIFAFLDIGRIYVTKSELETITTSVASYIKDNNNSSINDIKSYIGKLTDKDINVEKLEKDDKYTTIKLTNRVVLITPGINLILGNDYKASVERVITNE